MLEGVVQLADGVFEHETDGMVFGVFDLDGLHQGLCVVLVGFVGQADLRLYDTHADDLVAIVDQLVEEPLEGVIRIGIVVYANHESPVPSAPLIPGMANIEGEGDRVVFCGLAQGDVVKRHVCVEPLRGRLC